MAFAFNLGGDDIDLDEDDLPLSSNTENTQLSIADEQALPVRSYLVDDERPQDEGTRSFVRIYSSFI